MMSKYNKYWIPASLKRLALWLWVIQSSGKIGQLNFQRNLIIPISTITMIARITAPRSPKINQPIRKAITETSPRAPQFTSIANVHLQRFLSLLILFRFFTPVR